MDFESVNKVDDDDDDSTPLTCIWTQTIKLLQNYFFYNTQNVSHTVLKQCKNDASFKFVSKIAVYILRKQYIRYM